MHIRGFICICAIVFVLSISSGALWSAEGPYRFIAKIDVGGEGGWDYASVDSAARRLYVTHGVKIVVIDLDKNSVVGEIADTPGVHGFALAPELGLGFSSNGMENKASIVDLKTLQTKSNPVRINAIVTKMFANATTSSLVHAALSRISTRTRGKVPRITIITPATMNVFTITQTG